MSIESIPIIDLSPITSTTTPSSEQWEAVAKQINDACLNIGFFYVVNHGVPTQLVQDLFTYGNKFFELSLEIKKEIIMAHAGSAFRGYFELGGELTAKKPDWKEGLYFGKELPPDHPDVLAKKPMHGANLWPSSVPEIKNIVLEYMDRLTNLGHLIMEGLARSLKLDVDFFRKKYTDNPFTPFRLFYYPADKRGTHSDGTDRWGVGRHTDYGVLTILAQDDIGGLQVQNRDGKWIEAPPIPSSFIVNIGDMFQIWTNGQYKATPHRVKNCSDRNRLSAPFFFDPGFDCVITPIGGAPFPEDSVWNKPFKYGDYIHNKVLHNFPELAKQTGATAV